MARELTEAGIKFRFEATKIPFRKRVIGGSCLECGTKDVYQNRLYLPDFYLPDLGYYIETKGMFPSSERVKMKLVKQQHPELDIRILFQKDNFVTKGRPARYSDWAKENGFVYQMLGYKGENAWLGI